jgi:type I restriction enzyme M protein
MANERITENIVRTHFAAFSDTIVIDEQISSHPRINKLLQHASKSELGRGKPEFLITLRNYPELIIVIECKANKNKHQSQNLEKYSDYSVDGVLLYSQYLSKEFDVISIAVSGTANDYLVSHFLQLKGEIKAVPFFESSLLPIADYVDGYYKSPQKFRQDYENLLLFSKQLNDKLHLNKILEGQRSLLISCILIALENQAFKSSYKYHEEPKVLADTLVNTVINELNKAKLGDGKIENLRVQFSFIKTDTTLSTKPEILKSLVDDIDTNINSFIKTHEYFDILGQLYIEFLRYANSDKGLGIVLTPPHITEFFAEIAQVNKHSVIYDNCTGTGGMLISAMKSMIKDAGGNSEIIKRIKSEQLIGVEYQAHIFALAVSNMYIHQDGKTNIINGNCFEQDLITLVKAKKPNIGLLNPPYKSDKKNDIEEFEFVLNNLSVLSDGGICVAIIPMQCAIAQKGKS